MKKIDYKGVSANQVNRLDIYIWKFVLVKTAAKEISCPKQEYPRHYRKIVCRVKSLCHKAQVSGKHTPVRCV